MTPHQKTGLVAYRDKGTPLSGHLRRLMTRKGIISPSGVIMIDLDATDTRLKYDRIAELFAAGRTLKEIQKETGYSATSIYAARHARRIYTPTKRSNLRRVLTKLGINIGTVDDLCHAFPDTKPIIDIAAANGVTFLEAAGQLLRRNQKPY